MIYKVLKIILMTIHFKMIVKIKKLKIQEKNHKIKKIINSKQTKILIILITKLTIKILNPLNFIKKKILKKDLSIKTFLFKFTKNNNLKMVSYNNYKKNF